MPDVILRTSERKQFKECQWKWSKNYMDRLQPKHDNGTALWFGTGIHLALEKYYIPGTKRGADPVKTWTDYVNETRGNTEYINTYQNGDSSFAVDALKLGSAMLRSYTETYGNEEWMEVIAAEYDFQVGIKFSSFFVDEDRQVKTKTETGAYVGTMDLIFRDTRDGKVYVMDHKTARALGSSNTQYLPLDDQAGAYYAVAVTALRKKGLIGPKERITGVVYNYLVKSLPDERPVNAEGYATNKPTKAHYIAALISNPGKDKDHFAEFDEDEYEKKLKKLTVAKLEDRAAEQGLTVLGDVSKVQPPKRFERVVVRKTPKQQNHQIRRMSEDLSSMSLVRNGVVEVTKNPTRDCSFCPFQEICEMDEAGKDYSDFAEEIFTTWDPYSTHRKALS